jgi:serine/threonine protein kinase/tetratricopeptide (TPR) repeat protein
VAITIGTVLGRYEVRELLGAGGMGEVYRAVDPRLNRAVAIKVLAGGAANPSDRERFEREAQVISSLNHPHICTIYDVGHQDGLDFFVMECLEGETLERRLERGPMDIDEALSCAIDVADALDQAHRNGVIHRDLKPSNIMLTRSGAKLLDFGLAQPWLPDAFADWSGSDSASTSNAALTATGIVVGTPAYMSPERLNGRDSDASADVFAFGAVLFEMLSGRKAFTGATRAEVIQSVLAGSPPTLSQQRPDAPQVLDRIVERCLAPDPDERWQTARDLLSELRWVADEQSTALRRPATRRKVAAWVGLAAATGLTAVASTVWLRHEKPIDSIAVLPLENASGDPSMEFLSDGITEGVIRALSPVPGLKVMSRASVFHFKGKTRDLHGIAQALHVRALLVGRVEQRAGTLSISLELIDATDSRQLWGGQYTRAAAGVLGIEDDISREVSDSLRLKIAGSSDAHRVERFTESTVAYEHYLKGRYYWNRRTPDDLMRSVEFFKQAIAADPRYALAYAGLADAYSLLGSLGYDVRPPSEVLPKAKAAALRALELDDQLAEAYAAMGFVLRYEWDRAGAGRAHERSVVLNPNYATGRQWLASHYWTQGRFEDALAQLTAAQALDPLSPVISFNLGRHFYYTRDYDRAIEHFQRTLALDNRYFIAGQLLAIAHLEKGAPELAREQLRVSPAPPGPFLGLLSYVRGVTGDRDGALQVLAQLKALARRRYIPAYAFATAYAGLNMHDAAFEQLDLALADHSAYLDYLNVEPTMDVLRGDPRFDAILRRIHLPTLPVIQPRARAKAS